MTTCDRCGGPNGWYYVEAATLTDEGDVVDGDLCPKCYDELYGDLDQEGDDAQWRVCWELNGETLRSGWSDDLDSAVQLIGNAIDVGANEVTLERRMILGAQLSMP